MTDYVWFYSIAGQRYPLTMAAWRPQDESGYLCSAEPIPVGLVGYLWQPQSQSRSGLVKIVEEMEPAAGYHSYLLGPVTRDDPDDGEGWPP